MALDGWEHLGEVVDALLDGGNRVTDGGFRPTQGGWECGLLLPLDPAIASRFADGDARVSYLVEDDELFCEHCWTTVYGGSAAERYRQAHQEAIDRRSSE